MSQAIAAPSFDLEAALASLPACARCRTRRIKCDNILPTCANCSKATETCTYRDHVLANNVSRPDLAALVARYRELNAMKLLHSSFPRATDPARDSEEDLPGASPPSLYLSDPRSQDSTLFWGTTSFYSKVGKTMVTSSYAPTPVQGLERNRNEIFDSLPKLESSAAALPGKDISKCLLSIYHRSIETFYPIFGWEYLMLMLGRSYTSSSMQTDPVLLLILAVAMRTLSQVDSRSVEQARAYYKSFEEQTSIGPRSSPSLETLRCLLLRSIYMLLSQAFEQSWHLQGMAQSQLPELLSDLKGQGCLYLLATSSSLQIGAAIAFRRPIVLAEVSTLDSIQQTDYRGHSSTAFLVYKLSRLRQSISSFTETRTTAQEAFVAIIQEDLSNWMTDWTTAIADASASSRHAQWLRSGGSLMHDRCLIELLEISSQDSQDESKVTDLACRLVENCQQLYMLSSERDDQQTEAELEEESSASIFPFLWTDIHAICSACLIILQIRKDNGVRHSGRAEKAINTGLSLTLSLDPSQRLFRTLWQLQNLKSSNIE